MSAEEAAVKPPPNPNPLDHAVMYYDQHALNQLDQLTADYNLRQARSQQAFATQQEIEEIDRRIQASLKYLLSLPKIVDPLIEESIDDSKEQGLATNADAFAAALIVFSGEDPQKIAPVVNEYGSKAECREGLAVAIAWLPLETIQPWLKAFLQSKDFNHKWIACRACRLLCRYPTDMIHSLLKREDCQNDIPLFSELLLLAAQVKDLKAQNYFAKAIEHDDFNIQLAGHWGQLMLIAGDSASNQHAAVIESAMKFALQDSQSFATLSPWLVRMLNWTQAKYFLSQAVKKDELAMDAKIYAMAFHGDPATITWLLNIIDQGPLLRWLSLLVFLITGLDVRSYAQKEGEDDDSDGDFVLETDYSLPVLDKQKFFDVWRNAGRGFANDKGYFLGQLGSESVPNDSANANLLISQKLLAINNSIKSNKPFRFFQLPANPN